MTDTKAAPPPARPPAASAKPVARTIHTVPANRKHARPQPPGGHRRPFAAATLKGTP